MKRTLFWIGGTIFAVIIILFLGLTVLIKSYLKSDTLKAILIPKAEAFTGRNLTVDRIDISLLKGIVVKRISLKEKDGKKDFITAEEFVLDYSLMPLLRRQIVIRRIEVISPHVSIRMDREGNYNFEDLIRGRDKKQTSGREKGEGFPFSIATDRIRIKGAEITFSDERKELPDVSTVSDGEIRVLVSRGLDEIDVSGSLDLRELETVLKGLQITASGKIEMNRESIGLNLDVLAGKDRISLKGSVKDYLRSPDVRLDVYARELDLDRLMPAGAVTNPQKREVKGKTVASEKIPGKASGPAGMVRASGGINVDAAKFKAYRIKDFRMAYAYQNGLVTLNPLGFSLAGGEKVKVEGVVKGDMHFRYEPGRGGSTDWIKKTASGKEKVDLHTCEVNQSAISDAIALFTGLPDLRNPRFDRATFDVTIRDERLFIEGLMQSNLIKLDPKGIVDFDMRIDMLTDLKISPSLSARLPAGRITQYLKDEHGWTTIPLKIGGTVDKPSVGINPAAMGKHLERGIKDFIEKGLSQERPQKREEQRPGNILRDLFGR
jgi:AsmA family